MKHIITTLLAIAFILLSHSITGYEEQIHAPPVKDTPKVQTIVKTEINRGEERWIETEVTAFCACKICTMGLGICADGNPPKEGITVAAPRNINFGTIIEIENIGFFTVQDRTSIKYEGRIDIYCKDHKKALKFGKKNIRYRVVK